MKTIKPPAMGPARPPSYGRSEDNARNLFVRQVSDPSLLAMEILAAQREELDPNAPARTFVP